MADFSTEAELSIVVPRRELRSARQEVEDALADIPVGMSASGGGGGGATNEAREQRRRRREFRWARQRTDDTEAQLEILENIEGELTEGGLGGGGAAGVAGDVLGLGGEGVGIATDLGSSLIDVIAPGIGSLVGTALGEQVGGGDDSGGGDADPVEVALEQPEWVPLQSDKPEWVPLELKEQDDGILPDFEFPELPEFDTPELPEFEIPDPLGFDDPPKVGYKDPPVVPIEEPPMLEVRKPEWVPIQVERVDVTTQRGTGSREQQGVRRQDGFQRGIRKVPFIGDIIGDADRRLRPSAGGELAFPLPGESPTPGNNPAGGDAARSETASTGDVNVTVNADVQSAVQQTVEQVRREQERQRQELRRELESQISDLERQINSGGGGRSAFGGSIT